jgi:glucokinase
MILAGDIGGTKARLALFNGGPGPVRVTTYATGGDSLAALVSEFLAEDGSTIAAACFGVAGTVANGGVHGVNLPWPVETSELERALAAPVSIVNDLHANARGIEALEDAHFAVINSGTADPEGNRAVVSAGTGLGEAGLIRTGARYHAIATEGGHVDFAPRSELEIELYRFLAAEFGHVSYERICSGTGLVNIYRFLSGDRDAPTAAEITAEARADRLSVSSRALDLFVAVYGARAGNVALALMATGGVYLGGGIPPRIVERLYDGGFMRAFVDKGRFARLLEQIPVRVILDDNAALLGAARIAAERLPVPLSSH